MLNKCIGFVHQLNWKWNIYRIEDLIKIKILWNLKIQFTKKIKTSKSRIKESELQYNI